MAEHIANSCTSESCFLVDNDMFLTIVILSRLFFRRVEGENVFNLIHLSR